MTISKEAIEAAGNAFAEIHQWRMAERNVIRILEAALPFLPIAVEGKEDIEAYQQQRAEIGLDEDPTVYADWSIDDDVQAMAEALVAHNEMLRSAFQASQRDAIHDVPGTTNYRLLADAASKVLSKYHAITTAARDFLDTKETSE